MDGRYAASGYTPDGRSLAVTEEHAQLVRHVFQRYLALGSVRLLADALLRAGTVVPTRTLSSGKPIGGGSFTRGQLYGILKNVTYTGQIGHKGKTYPGRHPAIIDQPTFDAAQAMLASHRQGHRTRATAAETSMLAGRIVDAEGEPLVATHACRDKVRHRYYVSRALQHGTGSTGSGYPLARSRAWW